MTHQTGVTNLRVFELGQRVAALVDEGTLTRDDPEYVEWLEAVRRRVRGEEMVEQAASHELRLREAN